LIIGITRTSIEFGIINWLQEELQNLEGKTRKLLYVHGEDHTKADVDRLYIPRKYRRRGLVQLEESHAAEITKLVECEESKEYLVMQIGRMYQHCSNSAVLQTARRLKTEVRRGTRQIKGSMAEKVKKDGEERE
jgi:hypothetical protein